MPLFCSRISQPLLAHLLALILLGVSLIASGCHQEEQPFYLGGIQVNEPSHADWLNALEAASMNTVAVTVYAHQGNWNTPHLWFEDDPSWVLEEIRAAKREGLRVVLILRVALDHTYTENRFLWHGMIMPGTEEQVRSWFLRYTSFVTEWAEVAEREGVDVLGIGSELNALASTLPVAEVPALEQYYLDPTKQEEFREEVLSLADRAAELDPERAHYPSLEAFLDAKVTKYASWADGMTGSGAGDAIAQINRRRELLAECWTWTIDHARQAFSGKLTYAANFDQYHEVGFWDELDLIGINAYFPLRGDFLDGPRRAELPGELEAGWSSVLSDIHRFRQEQGVPDHPVLFTELGYTEKLDGTLAPWAGSGFTIVREQVEAPSPPEAQLPVEPMPLAQAAGTPVEPIEPEKRLYVWSDQPSEPSERVEAALALARALERQPGGLLNGILYWKLSTLPSHRDIEPFVAILGQGEEADTAFLGALGEVEAAAIAAATVER